jgi:hypothetical protein
MSTQQQIALCEECLEVYDMEDGEPVDDWSADDLEDSGLCPYCRLQQPYAAKPQSPTGDRGLT